MSESTAAMRRNSASRPRTHRRCRAASFSVNETKGHLARTKALGILVVVCIAPSVMAAPGPATKPKPDSDAENARCLECHDQRGTRSAAPLGNTKTEAPTADYAAYSASVHRKLACTSCHQGASSEPHEAHLPAAACVNCHGSETARYLASSHAPFGPGRRAGATCQDCHGAHDTLPAKDPHSLSHPTKIPGVCAGCHAGVNPAGERTARSQGFEGYADSVHFRALEKGGLITTATCVSCHNSHEVRPPADPRSSVNRVNVPATCGECHRGPLADYQRGVHGQALAKGSWDTPVCTDCHGEHSIRGKRDPKSRVFAATISKTTCPQCHSAVRINEKYGLAQGQSESYNESFHGLADQFGLTTVANCASCHGAHRILKSSDPESRVNTINLPRTCGKCHAGAGANFASGSVHRPEDPASTQGGLLRHVRLIYIGLIGLTISVMGLHNVLDYVKTMRVNYAKAKAKEGRLYRRFTSNERIQHALLVVSFVILVVTGFALKYPEATWVKLMFPSQTGFLVRGYLHRAAAIVFSVLSAYHIGFLIFTKAGREQWASMAPGWRDLREARQQFAYYLGLRATPAHFGHYSYIEKSEYFALIWGSVVMAITGVVLWFEERALTFLPKWGWDLAELVHFYEAWLATLSIFVWHFYHVAFKPSLKGVNLAMFTGELTDEQMRHEHPAELEALDPTKQTKPDQHE